MLPQQPVLAEQCHDKGLRRRLLRLICAAPQSLVAIVPQRGEPEKHLLRDVEFELHHSSISNGFHGVAYMKWWLLLVATCYAHSMASTFKTVHNGHEQYCMKWKQDGKWRYVYAYTRADLNNKHLKRVAEIGVDGIIKPARRVNKPRVNKNNSSLKMVFNEYSNKQTSENIHNEFMNGTTVLKPLKNYRLKQFPVKP